ncbi:MAG TPA: hypothetical protein VMX18_01430 [Candidatus Bipolaricaulota bacterium]|nr:hypothetical protein [Candidatus Bipolaricaulota bacterium]
MRTKKIFLSTLFLCLIMLTGCNASDTDESETTKTDMGEFFNEYCDIYVNKFQARDLESYGIKITDNMGYGYYNTIDECVKELLTIDNQAADACSLYAKTNGLDCDKAGQTRQENYKKNMTKDGCVQNGKNNRCALFDTSQPQWSGADTAQISDANVKYTDCLQKVDYACGGLPESW